MRKYAGCRLVDYPLQVWFIGPAAFGEPLLFFLGAAYVNADPTLHTLAPYDTVDGDSRRRQVETGGRDTHPLPQVRATLGAYELAERVCAAFGCPHYEHLSIGENVA